MEPVLICWRALASSYNTIHDFRDNRLSRDAMDETALSCALRHQDVASARTVENKVDQRIVIMIMPDATYYTMHKLYMIRS
jgi:hypothetical protein